MLIQHPGPVPECDYASIGRVAGYGDYAGQVNANAGKERMEIRFPADTENRGTTATQKERP